jgi:hypothetical protein
MSPLMAFRNSVKVTLLSLENEPARPYQTQSAFRIEPPAPKPQAILRPISNDTMPAPATEIAPAAWHARAEELRAMTDMLPSEVTRSLMPKIAGIYDDLASDAGWTAPEAPPPDVPPEDEAVPETVPPLAASIATPRRALPLGRRTARRRF